MHPDHQKNLDELQKSLLDIKFPQLSEALNELVAQQIKSLPDVSTSIPDLTSHIAFDNLVPKIPLPDLSVVIPDMTKLTESLTTTIVPALKKMTESYTQQFAEIAKSLRKITEKNYPPNWRGEEVLNLPTNLETLLLDEGLPLAWTPPRTALQKLFAASSADARRKVLLNNQKGIVNAALKELDNIEASELKKYSIFAIESAIAFRDGQWRASQALSTNLIDSILHQSFDNAEKQLLTNQTNRIDWKEYPVGRALVFGGIWGAYSRYHPERGDPIPRRYTRHASAHGVSRRQYTRVNSLIALMHAVALIKVIESDYTKK